MSALPTDFLARLNKVKEELLHYPQHWQWSWRQQNAEVFFKDPVVCKSFDQFKLYLGLMIAIGPEFN